MKYIGKSIKELRIAKGYSQDRLSEDSGLSLRTIQRIENNKTVPRGHSLLSICKVLDISIEKFKYSNDIIDPDSKTKLKLINTAGLLLLLIPYSNLFLPLFIWLKHKKDHFVNIHGRKIINFQITWVLITSFLLIVAPFAQLIIIPPEEATTFRPVLIVYICSVLFNIISVIRASKKINEGELSDLYVRNLNIL